MWKPKSSRLSYSLVESLPTKLLFNENPLIINLKGKHSNYNIRKVMLDFQKTCEVNRMGENSSFIFKSVLSKLFRPMILSLSWWYYIWQNAKYCLF